MDLYDILTERFNVNFTKAVESFQPVNTRKHEAELLEYKENHPSMMIERITYDKIGIIEYTVGIARGDRFKYRVVLNVFILNNMNINSESRGENIPSI
ncbi:UTRA domain-containing protein [Tepidibacillus decaturensis]|uniref:UbiC transcription regulator-associated domain-containing protein n=1 Tax=Tepidibacillus decaturensis TaxID=1413211 RepID=A0A135L5T3_9BACI|nr:hypothetical protein U473_09830 [Tepidibacillus decaturensis]